MHFHQEWSEDEDDDEEGHPPGDHGDFPQPEADVPYGLARRRVGGAGPYGSRWAELRESLVVQYWDGESDPALCSHHASHTVTAQW